MEKIKVKVDWCDKNFGAVTEDDVLCGVVVATFKILLKAMMDLCRNFLMLFVSM